VDRMRETKKTGFRRRQDPGRVGVEAAKEDYRTLLEEQAPEQE
jgi:hypothetical protein